MSPSSIRKSPKSKEFFNREEDIETACGFLKRLQCFSIIGENGMGRSAFLSHILSKGILEKHGIDPRRHIIVKLDMGSLYEPTKNKFIAAIVEDIEQQTGNKIESVNAADKLVALIDILASNGKNLIIALDEFERASPILDSQLSPWLRYIFQLPNVVAITASRKTIRELERTGSSASPLHTIFAKLRLGLFSREETERIIKDLFLEKGVRLNKEKISFFVDLSGGNPYLIQCLGFCYSTEMTEKCFENKMFDQARDIFEEYWNDLSEEEREFLSNVESSESYWIGDDLERRGFLVRRKRNWRIFSPLFCKFIETKVPEDESYPSLKSRGIIEKKERKKKIPSWAQTAFWTLIIGIIANLVAMLIRERLTFYPHLLQFFTEKIGRNVWTTQTVSLIISFFVGSLIPFVFLRKKKEFRIRSLEGILYYVLSVALIIFIYCILMFLELTIFS